MRSKTFDPVVAALKLLSSEAVKLDVGWTHENVKFWRFIFGKKDPRHDTLVSVFENGIVLVDRSAKMSKTRRNYFFELQIERE